jgi:membrane protein implicated in regulation of membrane protease activity
MYDLIYFWLVIALLFLFMEMTHPGLFFFLSFFLGGCAASIASFLSFSLMMQCSIFLGVTIIALYVLKRLFATRITPYHGSKHSNIYALYGQRVRVTKSITTNQQGEVKIGSELWVARSIDNTDIDAGSEVEVVRVSGAHVIVKHIKERPSERILHDS